MLYPTGMGLNRQLTKDGDIPSEWQQALDRSLGCRDWREAFYRVEETSDLLGNASTDRVKDASTEKFETFLLDRFRTIFTGVVPETVPLRNSRGRCDAVNPRLLGMKKVMSEDAVPAGLGEDRRGGWPDVAAEASRLLCLAAARPAYPCGDGPPCLTEAGRAGKHRCK